VYVESCWILKQSYIVAGSERKREIVQIVNVGEFYNIGIWENCVGRGSSIGIATGYGLDGPEIESRWGRDFPHPCRPALGPTQPPIQWVPGLFRGTVTGTWCWPPTLSSSEVKERVKLYVYSPSGPSWPVLGCTVPLPLPCDRCSVFWKMFCVFTGVPYRDRCSVSWMMFRVFTGVPYPDRCSVFWKMFCVFTGVPYRDRCSVSWKMFRVLTVFRIVTGVPCPEWCFVSSQCSVSWQVFRILKDVSCPHSVPYRDRCSVSWKMFLVLTGDPYRDRCSVSWQVFRIFTIGPWFFAVRVLMVPDNLTQYTTVTSFLGLSIHCPVKST
jgi:hypothetical protein